MFNIFLQISCLGKIGFLRYEPKSSWPVRLQDFQIKYTSRTKWWNSLIFYSLIPILRKWNLENIGVGVVKNGCGQSGHRLLKLALSQEGMIFNANLNSGKLKVILIIIEWASGQNRCGLLGHGTIKSAVSQEWFDESSWFFAC